jgi:hypothetical protein
LSPAAGGEPLEWCGESPEGGGESPEGSGVVSHSKAVVLEGGVVSHRLAHISVEFASRTASCSLGHELAAVFVFRGRPTKVTSYRQNMTHKTLMYVS